MRPHVTAVDAIEAAGGRACAYLELRGEQATPQRVPITALPFQLGRADANDYRFQSGTVSKHHAVLLVVKARYVIRDLLSTNGTFVNGVRVSEQLLSDGDVIHLGPTVELCFCLPRHVDTSRPTVTEGQATLALPIHVPPGVHDRPLLRELIDTDAVDIVYQPIVDLETREVVGYEALARGTQPNLVSDPAPLFKIADDCGMAAEMSRYFRRRALERAAGLPNEVRLFLNVHPSELSAPDDSFVASLADVRPPLTARRIVLEIAEAAVTDVASMGRTRDLFANLGLEFAYDDFGAGQGRLVELTDVPPQYLKLDIHDIAGIDTSPARQELVRALVGVVRALGVQVVAEGIETEACARTCLELGCDLGQGFLFGRPGPLPDADSSHERASRRLRLP
jgi:EAL domain-containing protein (putative c-di-GMP-specific phosphodiesterase class I)